MTREQVLFNSPTHNFDAIRYDLATKGYGEYTLMAKGVTNTVNPYLTIDGREEEGSIPIPAFSVVMMEFDIVGFVDAATDYTVAYKYLVSATRQAAGNPVIMTLTGANPGAAFVVLGAESSSVATHEAARFTYVASVHNDSKSIRLTLDAVNAAETASFLARVSCTCVPLKGLKPNYSYV